MLSTATQVPVTSDSVFQVGSITKPWTGTMIMQLVDEDRLSLDTTVAQVLPGIKLGAADVAGQVTPDGTRLLSPESAAAMREPARAIPSFGGRGDAVGLTWRLNEWGGRMTFGHDGSTVGQTAYLRADPRSGVIACLLTNADGSGELYQRVFGEVFAMYCGLTVPAPPEPFAGPVLSDVGRHAGKYERSSHRFDVSVRDDGGLRAVSLVTGQLGAIRVRA